QVAACDTRHVETRQAVRQHPFLRYSSLRLKVRKILKKCLPSNRVSTPKWIIWAEQVTKEADHEYDEKNAAGFGGGRF
ncbi:MAG: hypothetical protein Q8P42_14650, partial [Gallionella sp.]|nr:hypothetical protein [Gallionella sp.]